MASVVVLAGCRDLSLPPGSPGSGSGGPEVGFLVPNAEGAQLSINPDVELTAADVTGVAQVELRCGAPADGGGGQVQIRVWTSPPYRGTVDLTACKPLGVPQGNGTLRVALVAHAQDRQGNPSNPDAVREVVIDPDTAVLTTTAPARAAPGAPLSFTVTSDRDLQGVPQVLLGETVATVTGGPRVFTASFAQTPGIGIDTYDGGTPVPLEVLEDADHPVVLSIQGRTLTGNLSQLNVSLTLSRLRWSRSIPNAVVPPQAGETGIFPAAIPAGIQLPLNGANGWLPGFFARADGTYTPFPESALGDGGYAFRGFDGQGNALANRFDRFTGKVFTELFAPGSAVPIAPAAASMLRTADASTSSGRLARLDKALCEATLAPGCPAQNELNCVSPGGSTRALLPPAPADVQAPADGFGSGDSYLGVNLAQGITGCGSAASVEWELGSGGQLARGPDVTNSPGTAVEWAFPTGDGAFVVSHTNGGTSAAFLLQADGGTPPVYFSGTGAHAFAPDQVMVARRDHAVAIFKGFADHSEFELYAPQPVGSPGTGLIASSSIPSRLVVNAGVPATSPAATRRVDAVALADGKIALAFGLGDLNQFFYVVVVFDANMRPRWMYRIPEPVFSQVPVLVGTGDTLYFVDTYGQILHAFTP